MAKEHVPHRMHAMWKRLAFMSVLSFVAMYVLMYLMVDVFQNVYPNLNQFYMAATMTAAMVIIELGVMWAMYPSQGKKLLVLGASTLALVLMIAGTRKQVGINDTEFLRSMIPHHAGAILMCNEADLQDPELKVLCQNIVSGQQAEIDLMRAKLESR
jgi:uncharacterized protein (DUF305 family)